MTRLRKLAVKISDTVVCRSQPKYKDWALYAPPRGNLNSSRAIGLVLRWALAAGRWQRVCQNAPLTSMSEVPRAARMGF